MKSPKTGLKQAGGPRRRRQCLPRDRTDETMWKDASVDRGGRYFASGRNDLRCLESSPAGKKRRKNARDAKTIRARISQRGIRRYGGGMRRMRFLVRLGGFNTTNTIPRKTEKSSWKLHFSGKKREKWFDGVARAGCREKTAGVIRSPAAGRYGPSSRRGHGFFSSVPFKVSSTVSPSRVNVAVVRVTALSVKPLGSVSPTLTIRLPELSIVAAVFPA